MRMFETKAERINNRAGLSGSNVFPNKMVFKTRFIWFICVFEARILKGPFQTCFATEYRVLLMSIF